MATYGEAYETSVKLLASGLSQERVASQVGLSRSSVQRFDWISRMGPDLLEDFKRIGTIPDKLLVSMERAQRRDHSEFSALVRQWKDGTWRPPALPTVLPEKRKVWTLRIKVEGRIKTTVLLAEDRAQALALVTGFGKVLTIMSSEIPTSSAIIYTDV